MNSEQEKIIKSALQAVSESKIVLENCINMTDDVNDAYNEIYDLSVLLEHYANELEKKMEE